jgi:hypothetical protein
MQTALPHVFLVRTLNGLMGQDLLYVYLLTVQLRSLVVNHQWSPLDNPLVSLPDNLLFHHHRHLVSLRANPR